MKNLIKLIVGTVIPLGSLAGCVSVPQDSGFADVQKATVGRGGQEVHWRGRTIEDRAIDASVRKMLDGEISVDQAVQIALLNNRNLQATYQELGIAQADVVQAGLLRNPVFDASLRFPDGGGATNLELSVAQDFLSIFLMPLKKKVAEAQFHLAKWRVADAIVQLAAQTRSAFYTVQGAEQMLELRRSIVAATEASAETARRLHEAGNTNDLEFATQQAEHEQAKLDLAEAEAEVANERERLTSLMGLWGEETQWKIAHRLPELPSTELAPQGLESLAVSQRLDLMAAKAKATAAARELGLAEPFAAMSEAQIGIDTERDTDGGWVTGPTFSAPLPIFDQGQAVIARARSRYRQAREEYTARAVEIRSEVRAARTRMFAARSRAEYYRQVVIPLRHQIVQQTQLQYNGMLASVFQLLQAKQQEIEAGRAYVDALKRYWVARTELQRAVGGQFTEALRDATPAATPTPNDLTSHQH